MHCLEIMNQAILFESSQSSQWSDNLDAEWLTTTAQECSQSNTCQSMETSMDQ